jgi:hypothetical protein
MSYTETMFINALINAFPDDVPDPFYARWMTSFSKQIRYNVKSRKLSTIKLDAGQSFGVTPTTLNEPDWSVLVLRVVGAVRVDTVGVDYDGISPIFGYTPSYGTDIYPGYVILSTYNVDTFTLLGQTGGATVELFLATSEEDS